MFEQGLLYFVLHKTHDTRSIVFDQCLLYFVLHKTHGTWRIVFDQCLLYFVLHKTHGTRRIVFDQCLLYFVLHKTHDTRRVMAMVPNATFNNISIISWRSVLLVEEIEVPGENHGLAASNVVSNTSRHGWDSNSQL